MKVIPDKVLMNFSFLYLVTFCYLFFFQFTIFVVLPFKVNICSVVLR